MRARGLWTATVLCAILATSASTEAQWWRWFRVRVTRPAQEYPPATMYVDGALGSNCLTTYNPTDRTCGSGSAKAYNTLAGAAAVCAAGDVVDIRAGTYNMATPGLTISCDGTASAPIYFYGHAGEQVILKGPYDTDADSDGVRDWDEDVSPADGFADGPADAQWRMVTVSGDYVRVKRLRLEWAYHGINVTGSHARIEEVLVTDCWLQCGDSSESADDGVWRYNAFIRSRHGPGAFISTDSDDADTTNVVHYRNLMIKNGRQLPDDAKVGPALGDADGGGNSGGLVVDKDCGLEGPPPEAICHGFTWQENITWKSIDGCLITNVEDSFLIGNISWYCKAVEKIFQVSHGYHWSGNIAIGDTDPGGLGGGIGEIRVNTQATGPPDYFMHQIGTRGYLNNWQILHQGANGSRCYYQNYVGWGSTGFEILVTTCANTATNYNGDTSGTPPFANASYDPTTDAAAAETCLASAPHMVTIASCWAAFYAAVEAAFQPSGALVDGGTWLSGFHCPLADDNGEPLGSACRHWRGSAPDQGAFELGIAGNPDLTRKAWVQ